MAAHPDDRSDAAPVSAGWQVRHSHGDAASFHHLEPPAVPSILVHRVERPALVLGSTQRDDIVDVGTAERLGVEVCRRRSGGGVVLVDPDTTLWIDVVVPRDHPRSDPDVGRAFHWVGRAWAEALRGALPSPAEVSVHEGGLVDGDLGRIVCFLGLGPGEVTVDGVKVVGLSQRRTRDLARFQGLAITSPGWGPLPDLVRRDDPIPFDRPVGHAVDRADLERRVVAALTRPL